MNPMPKQNRQRIHDRVLGLRFMPGEKLSEAQIARALSDLWPGVTASQVKATIAGLASREKRIREEMAVRSALRAESG